MPDDITRPQRAASDPANSVWVTANAGSGKTYVLTNRVLRLLLAGVPPEEILCLTYTRAAAAEMRGRISARLAGWSVMDDTELREDLSALEGLLPAPQAMMRARALFAHALETPGGLKIQTIHAFCEAVLHRFPKEAGVPFDFTVIEDFQRDAMLQEAREKVIAAGIRGTSEHAGAVETLFGLLSDFQIETAITEALSRQPVLRRIIADLPRAKRELRRLTGNPPGIDEAVEAIVGGYTLTRADHAAIFELVRPDPGGTGLSIGWPASILSIPMSTLSMRPSSRRVSRRARRSSRRPPLNSFRTSHSASSTRPSASSLPTPIVSGPNWSRAATLCWISSRRSRSTTSAPSDPVRCSISTTSSRISEPCSMTGCRALGCATSSTRASAISSSTKARTPTRINGR
jgi:hypothetical protein